MKVYFLRVVDYAIMDFGGDNEDLAKVEASNFIKEFPQELNFKTTEHITILTEKQWLPDQKLAQITDTPYLFSLGDDIRKNVNMENQN